MQTILPVIINIVIVLLVIGVLTFIHELGHFLAAKAVGAKVLEFALGFGPKIFSKKVGETTYSLRALPFGGYVKILGDGDPIEEKVEEGDGERNLSKKPKWQQIIVMLAGVTMNILLAIVVYYIVLASNGWKVMLNSDFENFKPLGAKIAKEVEGEVKYVEVVKDGGAYQAGVPEKGVVKEINGERLIYSTDVSRIVKDKKGEDVIVNICTEEDNCQNYTVRVSDEGKVGMVLPVNYLITLSYAENKVFSGFAHIINNISLVGKVFGGMLGRAKQTGDYTELSHSVSGPVGIYFVIDYFKQFGFLSLLGVVAELSLSLAIINLLPIPALDGGRVFILMIEGILRKDLDEKIEGAIINISFIFLIILILFIIIKDIVNIDSLKNIFN